MKTRAWHLPGNLVIMRGTTTKSRAEAIMAGLGGPGNIVELEACITRLRTQVRDGSLVDEAALRSAGAVGVFCRGRIVQVVIGLDADVVATRIHDLLP
jgi:PTS system N-acetylglucosamine-specific IIB component